MFRTSNPVAARVYVFVNAAVALLVLLGVRCVGCQTNSNKPRARFGLLETTCHGRYVLHGLGAA
jgi:hypothetical protein